MMGHSTYSVVSDYLNNLLLDITLQEPVLELSSQEKVAPCDTINVSQRLLPCFDPFQLMTVQHTFNAVQTWLVFLTLLQLIKGLPTGRVKGYCLQQCQILLNQIHSQGM